MGDLQEYVPEFLSEAVDLLRLVENVLFELEDGTASEQKLHTAYRSLNFIKGGAEMLHLAKIKKLALKMEELLALILRNQIEPESRVCKVLLDSLDILASLLRRSDDDEAVDIQPYTAALDAVSVKGEADILQIPFPGGGQVPKGCCSAGFHARRSILEQKLSQGRVFRFCLNLDSLDEQGAPPLQALKELHGMGEILDLQAAGDEDECSIMLLYYSSMEPKLLAAALRLRPDELRQIAPEDAGLQMGQPPHFIDQTNEEKPFESAEPETSPKHRTSPETQSPPPERPGLVEGDTPLKAKQASANQPLGTAQTVRHDTEEDRPDQGSEYLTFRLGGYNFGLDILDVQEIIGLPRVTRLPNAPSYVLGVINLRGMVVPVMDLRAKLNLVSQDAQEAVVIVVRWGEKIMGALVDAVNDVVMLQEANIQHPPEITKAVGKEHIKGLCHLDQDLVILLKPDRILLS